MVLYCSVLYFRMLYHNAYVIWCRIVLDIISLCSIIIVLYSIPLYSIAKLILAELSLQ